PAPGWVGSQLLNATADDWEPAVATDPAAPYVYLLTTRYGGQPPGCSKQCPSPFIALTSSSDGGATFGPQTALCLCLGSKGQFDPTIQVVPSTGAGSGLWLRPGPKGQFHRTRGVVPSRGAVYSVLMNGARHNGFSTVFTKS